MHIMLPTEDKEGNPQFDVYLPSWWLKDAILCEHPAYTHIFHAFNPTSYRVPLEAAEIMRRFSDALVRGEDS